MNINKKTSILTSHTVASPEPATNQDAQTTPQNARPSPIRDRVSSFQTLSQLGSSKRGGSASSPPRNAAKFFGKFAPASQTGAGASCFPFLSPSKRKSGATTPPNSTQEMSDSLERSAQQVPKTAYEAEMTFISVGDELDDARTELEVLRAIPAQDPKIGAAIASALAKVELLDLKYGKALKVWDDFERKTVEREKASAVGLMKIQHSLVQARASIPEPAPVSPWTVISRTKRPTKLRPEEVALVGAMRHPDENYDTSKDETQKEYGRKFFAEVESVGEVIRNGKIQSMEKLWQRATNWRHGLAVSSQQSQAEDFGRRRLPDDSEYFKNYGVTPLEERYKYVVKILKNKETNEAGVMAIGDLLAGEKQILTMIDDGYIRHSHSASVKPIFHQAGSLAKDFLAGKYKNEAQAMSQLGTIHWWLANAMPNYRGSAACAEMAVRALAHATGRVLPPFKQGFVSDIEAMLTDREAFAASYKNNFDKSTPTGFSRMLKKA